ncbi:MAG: hypothetical protein WA120_00150 [Candidatus Hydromicrobium sp.]
MRALVLEKKRKFSLCYIDIKEQFRIYDVRIRIHTVDICGSDTCIKGGVYKVCCDNKRGGSLCHNNCTGGNTTGVYGSIAMHFTPML